MRIRLTRRALANLTEIASYIHQHSPSSARRVRDAIVASWEMLPAFPHAGRQQTTPSVRKLVVRRYPYLIYYRVDLDAEEIIILAIKHAAQRREHADE